ncbi:NADP-dependent oxidoreductase [Streptomyces sp. NBC_00199]|uniref:NADP-dependent oxidoreductase n=1 Tax=Streptomyces sp. NBC_00199 TaxID=2975678 RepID=UPI00224F5D0A|nr:NADP-dependent oxidoreductase [Streptomyces sp. NBC_00199]MCX5265696.1 NADP-dependent oxidoreductase [Streptomyces sp. NBC_00199]
MIMKSARIHEYGDTSVIRLDTVSRPRPGPAEVLIRVAATSFNPTETALRLGLLHNFLPLELPYALGWDVAGTVCESGSGVPELRVGDRVVGRLDGGAASEFVLAPAGLLTAAPVTVALTDAAALPVAGLTAWQAVFEHGKVEAGQCVLINGAGGGVGGFATQLAVHTGAEVIATAGPRSAVTVGRHGAHRVIDYTAAAVDSVLEEPVDVLLNLVPLSRAEAASLVSVVRPGGRIVSIATPIEVPADAGVTATHMVARNDVTQLTELVRLVDAGVVTVDISEVRPLAELPAVHRLSEAGRIRGKVVLIP